VSASFSGYLESYQHPFLFSFPSPILPNPVPNPQTKRKEGCTYKFLTAATTACVNGDDSLDILAALEKYLAKVFGYISRRLFLNSSTRHSVEHRVKVTSSEVPRISAV
jgi:hypothetical protein